MSVFIIYHCLYLDRVPVEITRLKLLTDGYFSFTYRHNNMLDAAFHTHTQTLTHAHSELMELHKWGEGQLFVTVCVCVPYLSLFDILPLEIIGPKC